MASPVNSAARLFAVLGIVNAIGLAPAPPPARAAALQTAKRPRRARRIYFRYNGVDADYGKLAAVDSGDFSHHRFIDGFSCEMIAFAAGHGICLTAERGAITTYAAKLFDDTFRNAVTVPLPGIPHRCRVSPDGKTAAVTVITSGHCSRHFVTETMLLDTATAKILTNLEKFMVSRDGLPFKAADFSFWGLTFTPDSKGFYGTLNTNGVSYLIKGDIAAQTASVLRDNVQSPSLSPDGALIAFNKPLTVNNKASWKLAVLDAATMKETLLAETRSVDDQLQWLDKRHVLYAISENPGGSSASTDVRLAGVDGKSAPELFLAKAYSPAVAR